MIHTPTPAGGRHRRPCAFCTVYPAQLRDADTGRDWCIGCATDLIHTGDPIVCFMEFDGDEYAMLLHRRSIPRRFTPEAPDP